MELYYSFTWFLALVALLAFLFEYMDSSLGMGYGTSLTPILLIMGYESYQIVPAVLLSEFVTGLVSAGFHTLFKNMTLGVNKTPQSTKLLNTGNIGTSPSSGILVATEGVSVEEKESNKSRMKELTTDSKVVIVLVLFGVLGTLIATIISAYYSYSSVFKFGLKIYIGIMVLLMGVLILVFRNRKMKFSFKRIILLGAYAGFNKGVSGGGYGPVCVSGQILSGREGRNAIASTSLSEGVICFVGVVTTLVINIIVSHKTTGIVDIGDWGLAPYLMIGAVLSTPLAALTTKKVENRWLKFIVGIFTVVLGLFTLTKSILNFTGLW
ncbi:MAG TPA: sulfite exporter TauE/SafE family protein [candidate division Zixibacteria bacterium]|nr:sulfite exporter TauE/SafE family protein [candidate division Zixibacteria bacterium]